jgi:hypothetical protein
MRVLSHRARIREKVIAQGKAAHVKLCGGSRHVPTPPLTGDMAGPRYDGESRDTSPSDVNQTYTQTHMLSINKDCMCTCLTKPYIDDICACV